jgi:hypothetical protein
MQRDRPELPVEIAAALHLWANEHDLDPDDAAMAVRGALRPLGPVLLVKSRDLVLYFTAFNVRGNPNDRVETVTVISRSGLEPLMWRLEIHDDGSACDDSCACGATELVDVAVGEKRQHGNWKWVGLPDSLFGLHTG